MRKRRILSLLLAVAVMATMLVAVPLTASATDTTVTFEASKEYKAGTITPDVTNALVDNEDITALFSYTVTSTADKTIPFRGKTALSGHQDNLLGSNHYNENNNDPTHISTNLYIKTKNPGTLKVTFAAQPGKDVTIFDNNAGKEITTPVADITGDTVEFKDLTANNEYLVYVRGTNGIKLKSFTFVPDVIEPTLTLDHSAMSIYAGGSGTITPTVKYFKEGTDEKSTTWEVTANSGNGITVEKDDATGNGIVKVAAETAPNTKATVTATVNDGTTTKTQSCEITVAENKNTVNIVGDNGVKSVSLEGETLDQPKSWEFKRQSSNNTSFADMPFGTYKIKIDYASEYYATPKVNDQPYNEEDPPTITINEKGNPEKPVEVKIATDSSNNIGSGTSVATTFDYDAINKNTITWAFNTDNQSSNEYLALEGSKPGIPFNVLSDTDGVYMTVDAKNGKFNSRTADNSVQINANTVMIIPVKPNSVVTFNGTKDRSIKIKENSESSETTITTDQNEKAEYKYKGSDNGIITATTQAANFYVKTITLETPVLWNANDTDSGYYTEGDATYGVIRFFQDYAASDGIEEYGFYIVKSDGQIIDAQKGKITRTDADKLSDAAGIYADLMQIDKTQDGNSTYYMKAYIKIGGNEIWGPVFGRTVDWETKVNKPTGE